eukprot:750112_1
MLLICFMVVLLTIVDGHDQSIEYKLDNNSTKPKAMGSGYAAVRVIKNNLCRPHRTHNMINYPCTYLQWVLQHGQGTDQQTLSTDVIHTIVFDHHLFIHKDDLQSFLEHQFHDTGFKSDEYDFITVNISNGNSSQQSVVVSRKLRSGATITYNQTLHVHSLHHRIKITQIKPLMTEIETTFPGISKCYRWLQNQLSKVVQA